MVRVPGYRLHKPGGRAVVTLNPIVIGDDYLAINNRSIDLFIDPVPGVTLGQSTTCLFGGESKDVATD